MAKIDIRKAGGVKTRKLGPTLFTEKVRNYGGGEGRTYYQSWRLRSDGDVQSRTIRTWDPENPLDVTEHRGESFTSYGRLSQETCDQGTGPRDLRAWLDRCGYTVVKEAY